MRITWIKNALNNFRYHKGYGEFGGIGEFLGGALLWIVEHVVIPIMIPIVILVVVAVAIKLITSIFTVATIKTVGVVLVVLLVFWFIGKMILEIYNL